MSFRWNHTYNAYAGLCSTFSTGKLVILTSVIVRAIEVIHIEVFRHCPRFVLLPPEPPLAAHIRGLIAFWRSIPDRVLMLLNVGCCKGLLGCLISHVCCNSPQKLVPLLGLEVVVCLCEVAVRETWDVGERHVLHLTAETALQAGKHQSHGVSLV